MWYLPAGSALSTYSPAPPVWAVTIRPVAVLVTVTEAFGITAPLVSVMVPINRAVSVWAAAKPAKHSIRLRPRKNLLFIEVPPEFLGTSGDAVLSTPIHADQACMF